MISTTSMNPDVDIAIFSFDHLCIVKIEHAHRSSGGLCVAIHICCVEVILCGPKKSARRAATKNSIMERYRLNEPSSIGKVLDGGVSTNTTKPVCHNHLHHKYERSYVITCYQHGKLHIPNLKPDKRPAFPHQPDLYLEPKWLR